MQMNVHRDLKPSNVLIDGIEPWLRIKIADIGMAVMSLNAVSCSGDARFCVPEVYRQNSQTLYNMAVEVLSTGAGLHLYVQYSHLEVTAPKMTLITLLVIERERLSLPGAERGSWIRK